MDSFLKAFYNQNTQILPLLSHLAFSSLDRQSQCILIQVASVGFRSEHSIQMGLPHLKQSCAVSISWHETQKRDMTLPEKRK